METIENLNVYDEIVCLIMLCFLIVASVFTIIYWLKTDKIRADFVETLDEHDKSVIQSYFNKRYFFVKKKKN